MHRGAGVHVMTEGEATAEVTVRWGHLEYTLLCVLLSQGLFLSGIAVYKCTTNTTSRGKCLTSC